jgi:hypothetical protein
MNAYSTGHRMDLTRALGLHRPFADRRCLSSIVYIADDD